MVVVMNLLIKTSNEVDGYARESEEGWGRERI